MSDFFNSAVLVKPKKPLKFFKVLTPQPKKGQVLVKIIYSGFALHNTVRFKELKGKTTTCLIFWAMKHVELFKKSEKKYQK